MPENSSSATHKMMDGPAPKAKKSLISETGKTGDLGAMSPALKAVGVEPNTGKARITTAAKSGDGFSGIYPETPAGKPGKTFINTGALKNG